MFQWMREEAVFPNYWEKSNAVPIYKETLKARLKIIDLSAFFLFSVKFLKDLCNSFFNYFIQNKLFTEWKSGFIPGDLYVAQLLSIMQEIYKSFNCNLPEDIRGTFLDISKAFDKVWNKGLILKLKSYDVDGSLLKLMENYLTGRQQKVVLNGQTSLWKNIVAGVPQGLCYDLFYFKLY